MQVIIDQVVSRIRTVDGDTALSPRTLAQIVGAVLRAIEDRERETAREDEELSQRNYQQRNRPWAR
jgi:hypothetical protein